MRTDAVQADKETGEEMLVNTCATTMVALDAETMRPKKDSVPPLVSAENDERFALRSHLAEVHQQARKRRAAGSMQLRHHLSSPPLPAEMRALHELHRASSNAVPKSTC